ncbi:MAG: hypothetical protein IJ848_03530 [Alphaproteobacteria bacterium]|nr:hypothetical protein [Alphaproteobacteria bacterium]
MNCNLDNNIASDSIFSQTGNDYFKNLKKQNRNNNEILQQLSEHNLEFLYNKKSIQNMKNIIIYTDQYNALREKWNNKILH